MAIGTFRAPADALFAEAVRLYPHENPGRAFRLFWGALSISPDAPKDPCLHSDLDNGDIGFAGWAAWVCHDIAGIVHPAFEDLIRLVDRKSPATGRRIRQRLDESAQEAERSSVAEADSTHAVSTDSEIEFSARLGALADHAIRTREWWRVRDLAADLAAGGQVARSEAAFDRALAVAAAIERAPDTIHSVRADGKMARQDYPGAARDYLQSIATAGGQGAKSTPDKLRRALSKAGLGRAARATADPILQAVAAGDHQTAKAVLEATLAGLAPVAGQGG